MDRAVPGSATCPVSADFGYRRWLDGLRGVAILLVLSCHMDIKRGGFFGVDVFFVLSGFLITSLLVQEWDRFGSISLPRFYVRRALRLLPAFWVLLIVSWVIAQYLPTAEAVNRRKEIVLAACYLTNWPSIHQVPLSVLGHTWSLSIEEQFYLLWPLLLYGMLRSGLGRRAIVGVVVAGIVATALYRQYMVRHLDLGGPSAFINILRLYMGLDTRADALLAGCLVGLLNSWDMIPKSSRWVRAYGAAAVLAAAFVGWLIAVTPDSGRTNLYRWQFSAVEVSLAVILLRLVVAPSRIARALLESWLLVGTGRISYALYLFHLPIILWIAPGGGGLSLQGLLVVAVSFAAAICSYFVIERPCLRLKSRLRRPDRVPGEGVLRPSELAKAA